MTCVGADYAIFMQFWFQTTDDLISSTVSPENSDSVPRNVMLFLISFYLNMSLIAGQGLSSIQS